MRRVSPIEHTARQFVLRHMAPACFGALQRASKLAETRIRRSSAIQRHVRGSGIEVGAAAAPALVPIGSSVKYVDKYDVENLRADPELAGLDVRAPDIIDSAETLVTLATDSQDFVLGFSLLEHVQDALGTIRSFHRVTRRNGSIVVSVPDKRYYGPDQMRPVTRFEHFVRDYEEGPEWSRAEHFREVGALCFGLSDAELESFVTEKVATDAHTHFHVWDTESFVGFLIKAKETLRIDYEILEFASYGHEALAVLRVGK